MIKLGVNSVLFKTVSFREAAEAIKKCGYDGVEISAIAGMCEHLNLSAWKEQAAELRVNIGPGGTMNDEDSLKAAIAETQSLAEDAEKFGITLCVKAHVGAAVYSTPTTLRMMDYVTSPAFGVDMDPSHIHRAGENPAKALPAVLSRMKHIHIRDCKGDGPSPGDPTNQACGRGDIDLFGYFRAMVDADYNGPVCLEVIGPDQSLTDATRIAAESYGYMNAILKNLGAR